MGTCRECREENAWQIWGKGEAVILGLATFRGNALVSSGGTRLYFYCHGFLKAQGMGASSVPEIACLMR